MARGNTIGVLMYRTEFLGVGAVFRGDNSGGGCDAGIMFE